MMQKNYLNSSMSIRNEINGTNKYFNGASIRLSENPGKIRECECQGIMANLRTAQITAQMLFILGRR